MRPGARTPSVLIGDGAYESIRGDDAQSLCEPPQHFNAR
jgi:hypothetical protein